MKITKDGLLLNGKVALSVIEREQDTMPRVTAQFATENLSDVEYLQGLNAPPTLFENIKIKINYKTKLNQVLSFPSLNIH